MVFERLSDWFIFTLNKLCKIVISCQLCGNGSSEQLQLHLFYWPTYDLSTHLLSVGDKRDLLPNYWHSCNLSFFSADSPEDERNLAEWTLSLFLLSFFIYYKLILGGTLVSWFIFNVSIDNLRGQKEGLKMNLFESFSSSSGSKSPPIETRKKKIEDECYIDQGFWFFFFPFLQVTQTKEIL